MELVIIMRIRVQEQNNCRGGGDGWGDTTHIIILRKGWLEQDPKASAMITDSHVSALVPTITASTAGAINFS